MMMRAAGVPARVVTGYLGGEWNPVGGYLIVRQSDAHAWTEVWLEGSGWTRIDPTAVVAPERLERGIFDLLPIRCRPPAASCTTTLRVPPRTTMGRRQSVVAGARGGVQHAFAARSAAQVRHRLAGLAPSRMGIRRGPGGVDRVGEPHTAPRRCAREAGSHRPRLVARDAQTGARRAGARRRGRTDGLRAQGRRAHGPISPSASSALASLYATLRFGRDASHQDIAAFEREVRNLAV